MEQSYSFRTKKHNQEVSCNMDLKKTEKHSMPHKLAIVIPAYKAKFLSETLDSIASQTDKRFCVYIGDDRSPENIGTIVNQYKGKFECVYKRFEENLGGKDLVAQWERCIDMIQGEEWIWLFSDDDFMDSTCVEAFYKEIVKESCKADLLRFDVQIIKPGGNPIEQTNFPAMSDSEYLFKNKFNGKCHCFAVEYIFSKNIYLKQNGFQNFDLAWNSDLATWMKFGINGITTIKGPMVTWRFSGENITTIKTTSINSRKWNASIDFLLWSKDFFRSIMKCQDYYIDLLFLKLLHGNIKKLSLQYCLKNSMDFIGLGLRRYIMLLLVYGTTIISKLKK